MFNIDKRTNKIHITKGDNAQIVITLLDKDKNERQIFSDDVITMTVKKKGGNKLIEKVAVNGVIDLLPSDTKNLQVGQYYYDIQLTTFGGNIYTVVPATIFEIGEEITI